MTDILVDIHAHTSASACGLNTHLEMAEAAASRGLQAIAITDHGPMSGGEIRATFFLRFDGNWKGMRILKGMEANVIPEGTDVPARLIPHLEVCLAGLHVNEKNLDVEENTRLVINAIRTCPYIDVISHPIIASFPIDLGRVIPAAAEHGVCMELNNSTLALGRGRTEDALTMLEKCRENGVGITVSSDAHSVSEIGLFPRSLALLESVGFPEELIMNRTLGSTLTWLDSRRINKTAGADRRS